MKMKIASGVLAVTAIFGANAANAFDGTINFTGLLTATTCAVTAATKNQSVTLPTLSTASMTVASPTSGLTQFKIDITGCTGPSNLFRAYFESANNIDSTNGMVKNTGSATNVALRLMNTDNSFIDASKPELTQATAGGPIAGGVGSVSYRVGYHSVAGNATAGTVAGVANYSIRYN